MLNVDVECSYYCYWNQQATELSIGICSGKYQVYGYNAPMETDGVMANGVLSYASHHN